MSTVTDSGTSDVHFDIPWCAAAPIPMDGTGRWHLTRHIDDETGKATSQVVTVHYDLTSTDGYVYASDQTNHIDWSPDGSYSTHEVQNLNITAPDGSPYYHAYTDKTSDYDANGAFVDETLHNWDVACG